ncbi:hypothetical protein ACK31M_14135 [Aeromonas caviae]
MDINEKKEIAIKELSKTFKLAAEGVDIKMFSKFIDNIWHEMQSDKEQYERFCIDSCGHIIHHSGESGAGPIDFVRIYEEKFGKMPDVWFMDAEGNLDAENFIKHIEGSTVSTGWDCTPTHNCL